MKRVLVVDDEHDTLELLRLMLELNGYQAFTVLNSIEAIRVAQDNRPDCALLDIMMPDLDGFTLCKMMRLHPATMRLPIIFVTAYSALDLEDRRREAGADMVLMKPVGMDALIEGIETAIGARPVAVPGAPSVPPVKPFLSRYKLLQKGPSQLEHSNGDRVAGRPNGSGTPR
ncbi:MAG: response regulator [Anaerolineae bacterium]|nr:response regulator [Anaerolineae bacterium]